MAKSSRITKRSKESVLSSIFLIAVLGIVYYQDQQQHSRVSSPHLRHPSTILHKETIIHSHKNNYNRQGIKLTEYTAILDHGLSSHSNTGDTTDDGGNNSTASEQQRLHPSNRGRPALPAVYEHVADLMDVTDVRDGAAEIPFFWHIARGGGSTVKDIMGGCLNLVAASDVGARYGHDEDERLNVLRLNGGKYVNVDATTTAGIERCKRLDALESGLVEVVVSPRLAAACTLFTPRHPGRLFAMLRDPIERAVSMFYYLGYAKWEKTYDPDLVLYELQDYARTDRIENNWMVRSLTNKMEGYLTLEDLELAKEIMRRKLLVGLITHKDASMKRFELYFGWSDTRANLPGVEECEEKLLGWGWSNKHLHPQLEEGSEAHQLLKTKNYFDVELYEYAKILFVQQGLALGLDGASGGTGGVAVDGDHNDDMIG